MRVTAAFNGHVYAGGLQKYRLVDSADRREAVPTGNERPKPVFKGQIRTGSVRESWLQRTVIVRKYKKI